MSEFKWVNFNHETQTNDKTIFTACNLLVSVFVLVRALY